jgi:hypothetical protein
MSEYKRFVIYIEKQVEKQYAVEIEACQNYKKNEIYGGRWFRPFCGAATPSYNFIPLGIFSFTILVAVLPQF